MLPELDWDEGTGTGAGVGVGVGVELEARHKSYIAFSLVSMSKSHRIVTEYLSKWAFSDMPW
jgi:hypothetical protein